VVSESAASALCISAVASELSQSILISKSTWKK